MMVQEAGKHSYSREDETVRPWMLNQVRNLPPSPPSPPISPQGAARIHSMGPHH